MDKKIAAEKIRALLEGRIARLLGCDVGDLHSMKIGSMAHFLFLLIGDSEVMPGFNTSDGRFEGFDRLRIDVERGEDGSGGRSTEGGNQLMEPMMLAEAEIGVPTESAEELIAEALGRLK